MLFWQKGKIGVGCENSTVGLLDRGFKSGYGFQAHTSHVLFLQQIRFFHHSVSTIPDYLFYDDYFDVLCRTVLGFTEQNDIFVPIGFRFYKRTS